MMVEHAAIPNDGLHEPKGINGASLGEVYIANGSSSGAWGPMTPHLDNRVVVRSASDLSGTLNSDVQYFIDGDINMGSQSIEVPVGGINLAGYNFNSSSLTSSATSYQMFTSPVGGSGSVLIKDMALEATGAGSQVYDLTDATGTNSIEVERVNYNNCTSLGEMTSYRQGLEVGTGRFGGTPTLTLSGTWSGGYFVDTSIVRGLSAGMTTALYAEGTAFAMTSRFRGNHNVDLSANAQFVDFQPSNFLSNALLQFEGCLISRNGVFDATDSNITPNIDEGDLESKWKDNVGIRNSRYVASGYIQGSALATTFTGTGVGNEVLGVFTPNFLTDAALTSRFTVSTAGRFTYDGEETKNFYFSAEIYASVTGGASRDYLFLVAKNGAVIESSGTKRTFDGSNPGALSCSSTVLLSKNDYVELWVRALTATTSIVLDTTSHKMMGT